MKTLFYGGAGILWLQSRITETWLQKRWSYQQFQCTGPSDTAGAFAPFHFRNDAAPIMWPTSFDSYIFKKQKYHCDFPGTAGNSCYVPPFWDRSSSTLSLLNITPTYTFSLKLNPWFMPFYSLTTTSFQLKWLVFLPTNNSPSHIHTCILSAVNLRFPQKYSIHLKSLNRTWQGDIIQW